MVMFSLPHCDAIQRRMAQARVVIVVGFSLVTIGSCGDGGNGTGSCSTPGTPAETYNLMLVEPVAMGFSGT
jgi:hypothetical protein